MMTRTVLLFFVDGMSHRTSLDCHTISLSSQGSRKRANDFAMRVGEAYVRDQSLGSEYCEDKGEYPCMMPGHLGV